MKDILVHLDGGERCDLRLQLAIDIARRHDAVLTGLFAQVDSDGPSVVARRPSRHLREAAARRAASFNSLTEAAGVASEWLELPHGEPGLVMAETLFCSRYADLVVIGQWDADGGRVPEEMAERLVLESGRPVLVIPHSGAAPTFGERIGVAWNASREASRALHDALPFLARADAVTVLTVRDRAAPAPVPGLPTLDIVRHLARRGIAASARQVVEADVGLMDALLLQSFEHGFDMLVMGAHSGLLHGAGTRFMLRHMTLPLLMSS